MAHKAFTVGGIGQQPGLDDVVKVALGLQIALDTAGSERIKKESPPPKSFETEPSGEQAVAADGLQYLNREQARAVLVTRLMSLMNGKSGVRLQVAEFLKELLNQGVTPALPAASDAAALAAVADACKSHGSCVSNGDNGLQALSAAAEIAGIQLPGVSAAERVAISSGASASAGVASLVIVGAKKLLTVIAAIAALSCEAAGAQVRLRAASILASMVQTAATPSAVAAPVV